MPASDRRKGHAYEREVAAWLRSRGFRAITSRASTGGYQKGPDVITDFPTTIECKAHKAMDLAGWVDQAVADANGDLASVWVKRRGRSDVGESYVVMRATDFADLLGSPSTET